MAEKTNIAGIVIFWLIVFFLTYGLSQALEQHLSTLEDFPFKSLIMLLVPAPEDSLLELIQFLAYWAVGAFAVFKIKN